MSRGFRSFDPDRDENVIHSLSASLATVVLIIHSGSFSRLGVIDNLWRVTGAVVWRVRGSLVR